MLDVIGEPVELNIARPLAELAGYGDCSPNETITHYIESCLGRLRLTSVKRSENYHPAKGYYRYGGQKVAPFPDDPKLLSEAYWKVQLFPDDPKLLSEAYWKVQQKLIEELVAEVEKDEIEKEELKELDRLLEKHGIPEVYEG